MKRTNMRPCHAKITTDAARGAHHVTIMTSADDTAWVFAEIVADYLKSRGRDVHIDRWQDTAEGSVAGDPSSDRRRPNDH